MTKVYTFAWYTVRHGSNSPQQYSDKLYKTLEAANKAALSHAEEALRNRLDEYNDTRGVDYKISMDGGLHVVVGQSYLRRYRIIEKPVES